MFDYDVIIVGGRVAGSSLAVRLGQAGLRVLLVERGQLPSKHPASSPIISPSAMQLLDELGAAEADYAHATPRSRRFVYDIRGAFCVFNQVADLYGRDYGYAIDRARFDGTLWNLATQQPTVTAWQNAAVTDLLREGDAVRGVVVRHGRQTSTLTAACVVGADGRFSQVARAVEARTYGRWSRFPTSSLYAYWTGVQPYDETGEPVIHFVHPRRGIGMLLLESADGTTAVTIEGQSQLLHGGQGNLTEHYMALLRQTPAVWRRLETAVPATKVSGMRDIANFYRQAGGPGWALTGDALHQKDPVDGQGIFDALFTAKCLSHALVRWLAGGEAWSAVLADYERQTYAEMHPMYKATLLTSYEYFYMPLPQWGYRTLGRWLFEDEAYRRQLALLLGRGLPNPARWRPWPLILRAWARGIKRDWEIKRLRD